MVTGNEPGRDRGAELLEMLLREPVLCGSRAIEARDAGQRFLSGEIDAEQFREIVLGIH